MTGRVPSLLSNPEELIYMYKRELRFLSRDNLGVKKTALSEDIKERCYETNILEDLVQ